MSAQNETRSSDASDSPDSPSATRTTLIPGSSAVESIRSNHAIVPDTPAAYPDPKDVKADLEFATDRLSTQARAIAFGTLAVIWATLIGEKNGLHLDRNLSLTVATLAVVTLLLDFSQYLAAYQFGLEFNSASQRQETTKDYENWRAYRWRTRFFRWKILCTGVTAFGLLLLVWAAIF
jgi:hypothetical protein